MLSGWTQSSKNWTILKDSTGQDIIQYNFYKQDLTNLRVYITTLSQYKELYLIDENIIEKQKEDINKAQSIINNNAISNAAYEKSLENSMQLNKDLIIKVDKYQKRAKRWPYWLGSGFIGGIILCLSVK